MRRDEMIIAIAKYYGVTTQKAKLQEECQELIQAINENDYWHTVEEIADVRIMLSQVIRLMNIEQDVSRMMDRKLDRQIGRIARDIGMVDDEYKH